MSNLPKNFYGTAYHPDGSPLYHNDGAWKSNQIWNDACWHRCVPKDATGLSLLDIGSAEGNYCLRFEQRGGKAHGLNFHGNGEIVVNGDTYPHLGEETDAPRYELLKSLWNADYKVIVGGFDAKGGIVPAQDRKFTIAQCLNVLEYILSPFECIDSLFGAATDRVLIATDIIYIGNTCKPSEPILQQVFRLGELLARCPWPSVFWNHHVLCDGVYWPQVFICATNPESKLPPVDPSEMWFENDITETQRFWLEKQK